MWSEIRRFDDYTGKTRIELPLYDRRVDKVTLGCAKVTERPHRGLSGRISSQLGRCSNLSFCVTGRLGADTGAIL